MSLLKLGILALSICTCNCITLFPDGFGFEYDYMGSVNVGTDIPIPAETGFTISGKLMVTAVSGKVLFQLKHIKSTYFNGPEDDIKGGNEPLPPGTEVLENPFLLNYVNGKLDTITVTPGEPIWAVNLKRAIAGVFQLDLTNLNVPSNYIDEKNIYGNCKNVEYNIVNRTKGIEISKVINFDSCTQVSLLFKTTVDFFCKPESISTASATRNYLVDLNTGIDGVAIIGEMWSESERLVQPLNAKYGAYTMMSNQGVRLKKATNVTDATIPANLTSKKDILFEQTKDFTQGREKFDQDEGIRYIKELSINLADSLEDEIVLNPATLHNNTINTIYWIMENLDEDHLDKLFADIAIGTSYLDETRKNLVLEILPQIGSYDSISFIKKLILNRKLSNLSALKLLAQYPFYVKQMSEQLLVDLEVFLDLNPNFDENIKNTAILSFATLIFKTYAGRMCSPETFEKYVLKYFTLFTDSTKHEAKMVYLHGLRNLQLGSVVDFLTPVVRNKENSHHIRFLAVWAFMALAHTKPLEMYKLYWPILMDRTEHLEMRVAALTMLIISQPTSSRLMSLYWYMQTEPSSQLYHFFYTTLNSLHHTTYPCYLHLGKLASKLVRYVKPPTKTYKKYTANLISDYINEEGGFGSLFHLFLVGNDNEVLPNIIYLTMSKSGSGQMFQQLALYVKTVGVKDKIKPIYDLPGIENYFNILKNQKLKLHTPEPFHFEFLLQIQDKTVFCKYFDLDTIQEVEKVLRLLYDSHFNHQLTVPPTAIDFLGTSDIGTFVYAGYMKNTLSSLRSNLTTHKDADSTAVTVVHDLHLRYMEYFEERMDIYNPIRNVYHALVNMKTIQTDLSYNTTLDFQFKTKLFTNKWDQSNGKSGLIMHGQTQTLIGSVKDLLYNQQSSMFSAKTISRENCKKQDKKIEIPLQSLGIKFEFSVFNCDNFDNYKMLVAKSMSDLFRNKHNVIKEDYISRLILYATHLLDKIHYHSPEGSCGISMKVLPYFAEPSVMEFQGNLDDQFINSVTRLTRDQYKGHIYGRLYKETDPKETYHWWNASLDVNLSGNDEDYLDFRILMKTLKEQPKSFCLHYDLKNKLSAKKPEQGFTSIDPIKTAIIDLNTSWGTTKNEDQCSDESKIDYEMKCSITKEQIAEAKSSNVWPFKQCKKHLGDRKFNPATHECLQAALEMSTYRKYDSDVTLKNVPGWMQNGVEKMYEALQYRNAKLKTPKFDRGNAKLKFGLTFPKGESKVMFSANHEQATVDYYPEQDIILFNPKMIRRRLNVLYDFGTCIVSEDVVRTQKNETFPIQRQNKYIALTQCTENTPYIIFVSFDKQGIVLNVQSVFGNVEVTPKLNDVQIDINGTKWNGKPTEHIRIEKRSDHYEIEYEEMRLTAIYRKEYVLLITESYHPCGICNPAGEEIIKYIYPPAA